MASRSVDLSWPRELITRIHACLARWSTFNIVRAVWLGEHLLRGGAIELKSGALQCPEPMLLTGWDAMSAGFYHG